MAIQYKSAGAGVSTETSGAALSPACPATVDANDILIGHVYWEGTTDAPSTPSGWTLLDGPQVVQSTIGRKWVFGRIADGSEDGAAVAFGSPAVTTQRGARIYSFSGYVSGTITQIVKDFAFLSHATDPKMPTVTTSAAGALAVALVAQNDNNTAGNATGESGGDWTEAVAEYVAALTPGLMMQIQTCTPTSDPGTVSGGSVATTNDPCGVVAFQILDAPPVTTWSGGDTASLTEGFTKQVDTPEAETVSLTEAFTKMAGIVRGDTVGFTEGFSAILLKTSAVADTLGLSEGLTFIKNANAAVGDAVALTESFVKSIAITTSDTLGLTEGFSAVRTFISNLGDTLGITEAFTKGIHKQQAETVGLTENLSTTSVLSAAVSDTLSLGEALQTDVIPGESAGSFDAYYVRTCTSMPRMVLPA